jgi:glycosyltransferase involved in cell wall biosynthesis
MNRQPESSDVPAGVARSATAVDAPAAADPRHPRRGKYPAIPPSALAGRKLKVAIVYAVLYRFRMPIFRRLSAHPSLQVRIFVGRGVPGTKFSNAPDRSGVDARILSTLQTPVNSTGRSVTLMANPTLPLHLLRFRPDVLLVQGGMLPNNWLTWLYARLTGTPIVWWTLGEVRGRQFRGLSALYRRLTKWVERRSTTYAGYSSAAITYFLQEGYPADRCFNLINVVDTELVAAQMQATRAEVPALRERLGLGDCQVLLFVGSLGETKGLDTLLQALAQLADEFPRLRLLVVGDGPQRGSADALARQLDVAARTRFVGAVYEGVSAYFQLGDLLVMPGTGGLAISEGMAHGLPVICSTGDGVEVDLIDEGENGFYVRPHDIDELTDRIRRSLQSPGQLQAMGQHSLRIIQERANIDRYLNEMLSAIYKAWEVSRARRD